MHQATASVPVAAYTGLTVTGLQVSFTDASTDPGGDLKSASVNWGDGAVSNGLPGGTFTHTYASPGKYYIILTVADDHNSYAYAYLTQQVSATGAVTKYDIGVSVKNNAGVGVQGATVYLKKNGIMVKSGYTDAAGNKTFNVAQGATYKVIVYKSAIDFDGSVAGKQSKVPATPFVLTAAQPVSFQQGTPATNGPVGKEWKGTNGTAPTITP
jgi:PKD repeat protein